MIQRLAACVSLVMLAPILGIPAAAAQTFNQATTTAAQQICGAGLATGAMRQQICNAPPIAAGATLDIAGAGMISARNPATISAEQARLEQIEAEKRQGSGGSADSSGTRASLGTNFSVYGMAGGNAVVGRSNAYEEAYSSHAISGALGVDYSVTQRLILGFAFDYSSWTGRFNSGGSFDSQSFGPRLAATFLPDANSFLTGSIGYLRQDMTRSRNAEAGANGTQFLNGLASSQVGIDRWSAGLVGGYDVHFGGITLGPRLGLNAAIRNIPGFTETGNTGLELSYLSRTETSVQSLLGAAARAVAETRLGAILWQASAAWLHEFDENSRTVQASYVGAPTAPGFSYLRAPPGRNSAALSASAVLLSGQLQPFIQVGAVLGDRNTTTYGGLVGLRRSF